jgi:hypothetical protein
MRGAGLGVRLMPYLTKYHLREQEAYALLGPVCDALRVLERRTTHFAGRVAMAPADEAAVRAAQRVLEGARQEVERIWQASAPSPEGPPEGTPQGTPQGNPEGDAAARPEVAR